MHRQFYPARRLPLVPDWQWPRRVRPARAYPPPIALPPVAVRQSRSGSGPWHLRCFAPASEPLRRPPRNRGPSLRRGPLRWPRSGPGGWSGRQSSESPSARHQWLPIPRPGARSFGHCPGLRRPRREARSGSNRSPAAHARPQGRHDGWLRQPGWHRRPLAGWSPPIRQGNHGSARCRRPDARRRCAGRGSVRPARDCCPPLARRFAGWSPPGPPDTRAGD
ncbi:hypothetical protein D3C78_1157650 [compost metagenome]